MDFTKYSLDTNCQFEHFFEMSADLLCIAGFDGYFKKINPSVSKLLGYTNEELFSTPINDFVYHKDKEVTEKVRNGLRNNNPLLNFENRYLTKNGEIVWLSWTSMPVYDQGLVFAVAKNITHIKKLEEERNAQLANLTSVNNDLKQLAYATSHNLKSPINNLLAIFNLLDASKIKDEQTLELLELLKLGSENLKQSWNDYIKVFLEQPSLKEHLEELDFDQCCQEVIHSISSLIQNSKTVLHIDFSELRTIHFNRAYLGSIFLNLITNSIKYSKPDLNPEIFIYSHQSEFGKQLIIKDNGLGLDMDKVKGKLFGLHQKFHNHSESNGIGLYLIHNHITSLGGRIEVESKINEGAKFIITFRD